MENYTITEPEAKAIGTLFNLVAQWEGEDVIGVLMKFGMFKYFKDYQNGPDLVNCAKKLEKFEKIKINLGK